MLGTRNEKSHSKLFLVDLVLPAETATECEGGTVCWVIYPQGAFVGAWAGSDVSFSSDRLIVATVAVVNLAFAEPKCSRAAPHALEVDEVSAVFVALCDARAAQLA